MTTTDTAETIAQVFRPFPLVHCDWIAECIRAALKADDGHVVGSVGPVKADLHPEGGYFLSTTKTLSVTGKNGRRYRVTVEEVS